MCFFSSSSSSVSSSTSRICCSCCCYCCYNCRVVVLALLSSLMHALLHYTTTAIRNGWTWPIWNLSTWDLFWEEILQATFQTFEKKKPWKMAENPNKTSNPYTFQTFFLEPFTLIDALFEHLATHLHLWVGRYHKHSCLWKVLRNTLPLITDLGLNLGLGAEGGEILGDSVWGSWGFSDHYQSH